MAREISRKLVKMPIGLVVGGKTYHTYCEIETITDVRDYGGGVTADFGSVTMGPTLDPEGFYDALERTQRKALPWWARLLGWT